MPPGLRQMEVSFFPACKSFIWLGSPTVSPFCFAALAIARTCQMILFWLLLSDRALRLCKDVYTIQFVRPECAASRGPLALKLLRATGVPRIIIETLFPHFFFQIGRQTSNTKSDNLDIRFRIGETSDL